MNDLSLKKWKIAGILATFAVIILLSLAILKENRQSSPNYTLPEDSVALFVGSEKCRSCHKPEFDKWQDSDHQHAMAVATPENVLGNFNNAEFEHFGTPSRFYKNDDKYYVYTMGPEGKMAEFNITHTFGWYPLQQYLIPFPGGRMQCLPIAWDVTQKKWYHLYPDRQIDAKDWLYWTNQAQNWNGMCAECHSTNLKKSYKPDTDSYKTSWSEISVGCEACHGPGGEHVKWADTPEMGRPDSPNYGLSVRTNNLSPNEQIELCAPCHSRRMSLGDNPHANINFLDYGIPQLLHEGYYFPDGQILEEVYVYGSFMQSKMYDRGVRCSDCHDVHSCKRVHEGNALCLQCHKAAVYDTADHHFHKKKGEKGDPIRSGSGEVLFEVGSGAQCEQCHMPGRVYMGIDYRPDHSLRMPRPDLTSEINTPNACSRCHKDKTVQWSQDAMEKQYGKRKRPHYGTILAAGRAQAPDNLANLIRLSEDRLYPPLVRATALSLLTANGTKEIEQVFSRALSDEAALMRYTAIRYLPPVYASGLQDQVIPLLYDPVRAVRTEAARYLSSHGPDLMTGIVKKRYLAVLEEYKETILYTADFAPSRHNLGNLYANIGEEDKAIASYKKAFEIDNEFYPAKINLAMLYNKQGNNIAAEKLFREVVKEHPDLYDAYYSLGLLLAEMGKYREASNFLQQAAKGLPHRARVHYNAGMLLLYLNKFNKAEKALLKAHAIEPGSLDYLTALGTFYLQTQNFEKADEIAGRILETHPESPVGYDIKKAIQENLKN